MLSASRTDINLVIATVGVGASFSVGPGGAINETIAPIRLHLRRSLRCSRHFPFKHGIWCRRPRGWWNAALSLRPRFGLTRPFQLPVRFDIASTRGSNFVIIAFG